MDRDGLTGRGPVSSNTTDPWGPLSPGGHASSTHPPPTSDLLGGDTNVRRPPLRSTGNHVLNTPECRR